MKVEVLNQVLSIQLGVKVRSEDKLLGGKRDDGGAHAGGPVCRGRMTGEAR